MFEPACRLILWDERRSSVEAHQILHMNGKREKNHRATVDAVAASLILEGYLASNRRIQENPVFLEMLFRESPEIGDNSKNTYSISLS